MHVTVHLFRNFYFVPFYKFLHSVLMFVDNRFLYSHIVNNSPGQLSLSSEWTFELNLNNVENFGKKIKDA